MKKYLLTTCLLMCSFSLFANDKGISLTRGFNGVDDMNGFGLSYKSYWGNITNIGSDFELAGLWDFSLSYWHTSKSKDPGYSNITVFSLLPTFRLQRRFAYNNGIAPFVDLGYGLSLFNRQQFSGQQLGGYGSFVLTAGFGINFGQQSQYDLSYHYLSYSNAGQFKHDDGMYVNTLSFTYRFAGQ
jgi:outer membrane protein W